MSVLTERARRDAPAEAVPATDDPGRPQRWRQVLAAVLALVVLVCVALLVWLSAGGRGSDGGGLGTYSPDMLDDSGQMPAYRDQVREVITPKFAADFDKEVATAEQLVAQGGITRTADVFATAVSSIDDDSARVLVAGAFTDSYEQAEGKAGSGKSRTVDQEPLPFRFTVDLVLIAGEWLVDDFAPVSSPDEQAPGTTPQDGTEGSTP